MRGEGGLGSSLGALLEAKVSRFSGMRDQVASGHFYLLVSEPVPACKRVAA